ncbi:MAG: hypothetical protein NWF01_08110 [Candidatus Bathyarchaeota archaeon]|nr:hypothetical protein [Candidatus Bathyarchaeota archaeon]
MSIQAPVFALTQGPPEVISQSPSGIQVDSSASALPEISGYNLTYSYRDKAYEQTSGNDAAIVYIYRPQGENKSVVTATIQIGVSSTSQHRWETCLINYPLSQGQQAKVEQLDLHDIQIQDNPPITARYFSFQYTSNNRTEVVLYWYQTANFNVNGTAQTKSVMMSLIIYPKSVHDLQDAENQLLPIAQAINLYWQPLKTWSSVSLVISQNGFELSVGAAVVFVSLLIYQLYLSRKEKVELLTLYRKLPEQSQLLIKAISSSKMFSTQEIIAEFQKVSQADASEGLIASKLEDMEKSGLIKKALVNKRDNPVLLWKNLVPKQAGFFGVLKSVVATIF